MILYIEATKATITTRFFSAKQKQNKKENGICFRERKGVASVAFVASCNIVEGQTNL